MAEHGRLIDADALKDRLQRLARDDWSQRISTSYADALNEVVEMLDDAPAIEPDWYEMLVICDNCGHAIHVKRWGQDETD